MIKRGKYANLPTPPDHRIYEVGDEVIYGGHDKAIIMEVHDGGMSYNVEVTNDRSKKFDKEPVLEIELREDVKWTDLLPINSGGMDQVLFSDPAFHPLSYQQRDIYGLLVMVYSQYGFDFDPDYQRGHVWDLEDKRALIESILAKRDIGKFVINQKEWHDTDPLEEIIDGKQRLSAIKEFYEDGFTYNGLYYSQLHPRDRGTFEHKAVSVAMLKNATREELLRTFLAVNICGKQQNLDHIENVKKLLEETK